MEWFKKKLISQEWKKIPPRNYLWLNDYIFQKLSIFVDIIFEKIENYMSKLQLFDAHITYINFKWLQ